MADDTPGTPGTEVANSADTTVDFAGTEVANSADTTVDFAGTEVAELGELGTEVPEPPAPPVPSAVEGSAVEGSEVEGGTEVSEPEETTGPADLGDWRQCDDDAACQATLGAGATCNGSFPGGQCVGCDPANLGDARCSQLAQGAQTLTCREGFFVCLFDCPCPPWLRCLGEVCALKTCTSDDECGPLICRPISEGDTRYCLAP